jgi:hypothetical protein
MDLLKQRGQILQDNYFKQDSSIIGLVFSENNRIIELKKDRNGPKRCSIQAVIQNFDKLEYSLNEPHL